jgi:hypothetical protein
VCKVLAQCLVCIHLFKIISKHLLHPRHSAWHRVTPLNKVGVIPELRELWLECGGVGVRVYAVSNWTLRDFQGMMILGLEVLGECTIST